MDRIKAKYVKSRFTKAMDNGRVFGIWVMTSDGVGDFTAVGQLDDSARVSGLEIMLAGEWEMHKQYGAQFRFSSQSIIRPAGEAGTIAFLQQAPGIGRKKATVFWDRYKDDALERIVKSPNSVKKDFPHMDNIDELSEFFRDKLMDASVRMPLVSLFGTIGFPKNLPDQVLLKRWPDPVGMITQNPFRLLEFYGANFLRCDKLRKQLKLSVDMPERKIAAMEHVLRTGEESIWMSLSTLKVKLTDLLGQAWAIDTILEESINNRRLARIGRYVALYEDAICEKAIARWLVDKTRETMAWPKIPETSWLSPHQRAELDKATSCGGVAFLMGLPGTGKSTVSAELIKHFTGTTIACSPTGKAAVRLTESLRRCGVDNIVATTIHKALQARPDNAGGYNFAVNGKDTFIEADLVVVDEGSMLNNHLFFSLIRAIRSGTGLLVLGDPNQLAPIGRGSLLNDWKNICAEHPELSYGLLTDVRRNSGEILTTSAAIYRHQKISIPEVDSPGFTGISSNIQLAVAESSEEMVDKLAKFYRAVKAGRIIIPGKGFQTIDPVQDIQVILANNEGSVASRKEVNLKLQPILNPAMQGHHPKFKLGDKIIVLENKMFDSAAGGGHSIAINNGELGRVVKSAEKFIHVAMDGLEDETAVIPCGTDGNGLVDLGYAISVHKAQGSEYRVVVVLAPDERRAERVCDAGWLTTAITRAQELCIVIGRNETLNRMRQRNFLRNRISLLPYWVDKFVEEPSMPAATSG